jgi:NAD-dependent deacetylase
MPQQTESDLVNALTGAIKRAQNVVVFTGAGLSTESGIPDFRGPKGIWRTQTPIDFSDFITSEDWRRESWRRRFSGRDRLGTAEPNLGHAAIAHWVLAGKISRIITQNVDGLHQKSGVPDHQIIELHGNAQYATCLSCGDRHELDAIRAIFLPLETVPDCQQCGGIIKTATISFGQAMPETEMQAAHDASTGCDLFIVIGSSLTVYPAAGFPVLARQQGADLIIINHQATDLDPIADLVIPHSIGSVLSEAAGLDQIIH